MIHANIPKSPTQHLTYRLRHLVDVREPEGDAEMERKRERQSSDWKEAKERTGRDGSSSLYYKRPISLFPFRPPRRHTHCHQPLPALLSLSPFITHTFKAFSSVPYRWSATSKWRHNELGRSSTSKCLLE